MKVYSPSDNHKLDKILFASKVFEQDLAHVEVPFNNKNKPFLEAYPHCSMPALEYQPSRYIFGEHTILRFISPKPDGPFQAAEIDEWLEIIEKDLETPTGVLVLLKRGYAEISEEQRAKAIEAFLKFLKVLDDRLKLRTFIVGDRMGIVDMSIFYNMRTVRDLLEEGKTKGLSNVNRWYSYISSIAL